VAHHSWDLKAVALGSLALIGIGYSLALLGWYWPGNVGSGPGPGVWSALAWDFAQGELYRPLWDERGTGGTRYMPAFFVLHGLAIRLGADSVTSGIALVQLSVLSFCGAIYAMLRELRVAAKYAVPLALSTYATSVFHAVATSIKCDYLAAALVVASLAAILRSASRAGVSWLIVAGFASALAFFVKVTAAYVVVLAVAWLWPANRLRACGFLAGVISLIIAGLAGIEAASHGNFSANFREVLLGTGDLSYAFGAPRRLAGELFYWHPDLGTLCATAVVWTAIARRTVADPSAIRTAHLTVGFLCISLALSIAIFASPGAVYNHLVDLQAACVLVMGLHLRDNAAPGAAFVFGVLALGLTATLLPGVPSEFKTIGGRGMTSRRAIVALHQEFLTQGPYLSEDPLVPLVNGDRPYILDAFSLSILAAHGHTREMENKLANAAFTTIVLDAADAFPRDLNRGDPELERLGPEFLRRRAGAIPGPVETRYELIAVRSSFAILLPRDGPPR